MSTHSTTACPTTPPCEADLRRHLSEEQEAANNIALALRLMGRTEGAAVFLAGHALGDDEGDLHPNWPETDPLEDQQHPVWEYGWPPESG